MTSGVPISSIESRDEGSSKREVGSREPRVRHPERLGVLPLLSIHEQETLRGKRGYSKERNTPRRESGVRVDKNGDHERMARGAQAEGGSHSSSCRHP